MAIDSTATAVGDRTPKPMGSLYTAPDSAKGPPLPLTHHGYPPCFPPHSSSHKINYPPARPTTSYPPTYPNLSAPSAIAVYEHSAHTTVWLCTKPDSAKVLKTQCRHQPRLSPRYHGWSTPCRTLACPTRSQAQPTVPPTLNQNYPVLPLQHWRNPSEIHRLATHKLIRLKRHRH